MRCRWSALSYGGLGALVLVAYGAVVSTSYGALDDYPFLADSQERTGIIAAVLVCAERPLNSALLDWGFSWAGTIEGLSMLRAEGLMGILLFGLLLQYAVRLLGPGRMSSLLIGGG